MTATAPITIRTEGLVKAFGTRTVVNGVDIRVDAGEIVESLVRRLLDDPSPLTVVDDTDDGARAPVGIVDRAAVSAVLGGER